MFKLDDNFLIELGLGGLPVDDKKAMLNHIYETLEMRVGMKLAEQMTNEQLDEFEGFIQRNDEPGALNWLETNFPNYKQVVAEELERLKGEIKTAAPQILAAAGQPAAQPAVQPVSMPAAQPQMPPLTPYQQPAYDPSQQPMQPQFQQPYAPQAQPMPMQPAAQGPMPQQPATFPQQYPDPAQAQYPQQPVIGQQQPAQQAFDPSAQQPYYPGQPQPPQQPQQ